ALLSGRTVPSRPQRDDRQQCARTGRGLEGVPARSKAQEEAVKMIPDRTGRFPESPHWEIRELEQMCEDTITSFLRDHFGFERIPVPTEAVTMLIERDAADLDLATNLSDDIHEVFGFTQFERGQKPVVKIARELWEQRHRNNRLRTTLTHEYGHYADSRIMPRFSFRPARLMGRGPEMSA